MIVALVMLLFISRISSWYLFQQEPFNSTADGITFTNDDKAYIVGDNNKIHLHYINESGSKLIDLMAVNFGYVYKCVISKGGTKVFIGGNDPYIYLATYPQFSQNLNSYLLTSNDKVYDMDFSYDDTKLVICGDDNV